MPEDAQNPPSLQEITEKLFGKDVAGAILDPEGHEREQMHRMIENDFGFHPATKVTGPKHDRLRALFIATAKEAVDLVPKGTERQYMVEHLRMAMMYGNAGVAIRLAPPVAEEKPKPQPRGNVVGPGQKPDGPVDDHQPEAPIPALNTRWIWEPDKSMATEYLVVTDVSWNGEQWWVYTRRAAEPNSRSYPNDLSRFWEACVPDTKHGNVADV